MFDDIVIKLMGGINFLFNDGYDNIDYVIEGLLSHIKTLRNNVKKEYILNTNEIKAYKSEIMQKMKNNGNVNLVCLNEEFTKNVPNCDLTTLNVGKLKCEDLYKMLYILLDAKQSVFVKLDKLEKSATKDSKFLQYYCCYLFNPKKELKKFKYDSFKNFSEKVFISGKSVTNKHVTSVVELANLLRGNYSVDDYRNINKLLDSYENTIKAFRRPKIPKTIEYDKRVKYLKDYIYNISKLYEYMYFYSMMVYTSKLRARSILLKKSL